MFKPILNGSPDDSYTAAYFLKVLTVFNFKFLTSHPIPRAPKRFVIFLKAIILYIFFICLILRDSIIFEKNINFHQYLIRRRSLGTRRVTRAKVKLLKI